MEKKAKAEAKRLRRNERKQTAEEDLLESPEETSSSDGAELTPESDNATMGAASQI